VHRLAVSILSYDKHMVSGRAWKVLHVQLSLDMFGVARSARMRSSNPEGRVMMGDKIMTWGENILALSEFGT
jgi:hypothetical protein